MVEAFACRTAAARGRLLLASLSLAVFLLGAGHDVARSQNQGILVVGATNVSPLALTHGCNLVTIQSPNGTPVAAIAALVSPSMALQSIWRYNNAVGLYQVGYFADAKAPVTFSATGSGGLGTATESYFVCVNQAATIISI
jgi:hypothetical protein